MTQNETPRPEWIEGVDLDSLPPSPDAALISSDFEWTKIPEEYRQTWETHKNYVWQDMLMCRSMGSTEIKLLETFFEFAIHKLFLNDKSFSIKKWSSRESGILVTSIREIISPDGLETYSAVLFVRNKRIKMDNYKKGISKIVAETNNILRYTERPQIPPFT